MTESEIILNNLKSHKSDIKIIASDLNFGNIYYKQPILIPKPLDSIAPELFMSYGFTQLIDIPTRVREHIISLVDLFFVSSVDSVTAHGTLPSIADHDSVQHCHLPNYTKKNTKTTCHEQSEPFSNDLHPTNEAG